MSDDRNSSVIRKHSFARMIAWITSITINVCLKLHFSESRRSKKMLQQSHPPNLNIGQRWGREIDTQLGCRSSCPSSFPRDRGGTHLPSRRSNAIMGCWFDAKWLFFFRRVVVTVRQIHSFLPSRCCWTALKRLQRLQQASWWIAASKKLSLFLYAIKKNFLLWELCFIFSSLRMSGRLEECTYTTFPSDLSASVRDGRTSCDGLPRIETDRKSFQVEIRIIHPDRLCLWKPCLCGIRRCIDDVFLCKPM